MTDLTTKTAQSLHAEWCRQMREKGSHAPGKCPKASEKLFVKRRIEGEHCNKRNPICPDFDHRLSSWHSLPESRRQEYLVTATAVLPEIVGGVFDEAVKVAVEWGCTTGGLEQDYRGLSANDFFERYGTNELMKAILNLRARRLEELKDE